MNPSIETCCMIEGWDLKYHWNCIRLPVRHILQWQTLLSLQTELNSNAVTCKVCARSCCRLRSRVHTQPHQCTNPNPDQSCGSDTSVKRCFGNHPSRPSTGRVKVTVATSRLLLTSTGKWRQDKFEKGVVAKQMVEPQEKKTGAC